MLFNKQEVGKNNVKGTIVLFHGFLVEGELYDLIQKNFQDYEIICPNLYNLITAKDGSSISWKENIINYLIQLSQEKGDLLIVGYTMGSVLASAVCGLDCIKKMILISSDFNFTNMLYSKDELAEIVKKKYIESNNINFSLFQIAYDKLVNDFERSLELFNRDLLLIQGIDNGNFGYTRILRTFLELENKSKQFVSLGTSGQEMLEDVQSQYLIPMTIRLFLEGKLTKSLSNNE